MDDNTQIREILSCSGPTLSECETVFHFDVEHCNVPYDTENQVLQANPALIDISSNQYQPNNRDYGDIREDVSDCGEFHGSSDENLESDDDLSDVPAEILKDVLLSDVEDIFAESVYFGDKELQKNTVSRKEKCQNIKDQHKVGNKRNRNEDTCNTIQWYSDDDKEDDFTRLDGLDDQNTRHLTYKEGQDMRQFKLVVGMKFKSAQEFREVLRDNIVRSGYELVLIKNERTRITGICKNGCDWRIHASLVQGGPTFQIKTISGLHTCARSHCNKFANYKYLNKRIEKIVRDNPDIKIEQLQNIILRKCAVTVGYWKVLRAKKTAIQKIRGVDSVQYQLLRDYCETVLMFNPGSKIIIRRKEDFEPPTFDKLYFSLHAMKNGFLSGCRPIIGLDGCFLKTVHGGQLLSAIGRDGNDNLVPIAFAIVQVENRENWTWFLSELLEDIGGLGEDKWTFMSDRQKGLIEALKDLVPDSEHRFCLRHMYQNFKKKYKGVELKELFWKAGTTANKNDFDGYMKKIAQADPKLSPTYETAFEWLQKISAVHWARSHFSTASSCDVVVNNLCESFNSYILDARDKPIITMLESIRLKLMKRIQLKKDGMEKYNGEICPNILRRINKNQNFSRNFMAIYSGEKEYQIRCLSSQGMLAQYVVDLMKKTCTCGMFQLCGYPCSHACAAIGYSRYRLEDYVRKFYTKNEYLRIYSHMIHAVPGQSDYCKSLGEPLNAPMFKAKKGRPQRLRRREADEGLGSNSTRKGLTHRCSKCLELGHNVATCKNSTHPKSKFHKVPRRTAPSATSDSHLKVIKETESHGSDSGSVQDRGNISASITATLKSNVRANASGSGSAIA